MAYKNPSDALTYKRKWSRKNKKKVAAIDAKSYDKHKERRCATSRDFATRRRMAVLVLLGGKCVRCGFDDVRALQIDHINGDGHIDRKHRHSAQLYRDILKMKKEEVMATLQLLCANCNSIKRYENGEFKPRKYV